MKNMIVHSFQSLTTAGKIGIAAVAIAILIVVIWLIAYAIRKPKRIRQFEQNAMKIGRRRDCPRALEIYKDCVHVMNWYGRSIESVGFKNLADFHQAAVACLEAALATAEGQLQKEFAKVGAFTNVSKMQEIHIRSLIYAQSSKVKELQRKLNELMSLRPRVLNANPVAVPA